MNVILPYMVSLLAANPGLQPVALPRGVWMPEHHSHHLVAKGKIKQSKDGGLQHQRRASSGRTGFQHVAPSFNRGNIKPIGGWRDGHVGATDVARDARIRAGNRRDGRDFTTRGSLQNDWQRVDERWDRRHQRTLRQLDNDWQRVDDRWDRRLDRAGTRLDHRLNRIDRRLDRLDDWGGGRWPGWARRGWGLARPWNYGWYGNWNNNPPWGWWGARAAAWGIGTLATASIINHAVDDAIDAQSTTIGIPESEYRLIYGSVLPTSDQRINFIAVSNDTEIAFSADCSSGDLNGQAPATASEAELLNAACQIAFGNS